jgi:DNA polymerase
VTDVERRQALEAIAAEVRVCTNCRLHETRTLAVPGEGDPETEVVLVGEGPGFNEDRSGRPFVGRAGDLLVKLLASIGWRRDEVFITNIVKCRPPDNRDPQPDEIAACAPYLRRQLEVLDPAVVVTLGRHSLGRFMPGARISQAHGTVRPIPPETGARDAVVFAMYHPAAALRTPALEVESYADIAGVPTALIDARRRREAVRAAVAESGAEVGVAVAEPPEDAPGVDLGLGPAPTGGIDAPSADVRSAPSESPATAMVAAVDIEPASTTKGGPLAVPTPPTADDTAPQLTLF